jgi:hypothetical protein
MKVTTYLRLVPRLKMRELCLCPHACLHDVKRENFTFTCPPAFQKSCCLSGSGIKKEYKKDRRRVERGGGEIGEAK